LNLIPYKWKIIQAFLVCEKHLSRNLSVNFTAASSEFTGPEGGLEFSPKKVFKTELFFVSYNAGFPLYTN
jgi:hypothetical protein